MRNCVIAGLLALTGGANAADQPVSIDKSALCAANEKLIEHSLKVIALNRETLISDEIDVVTERGRPPGVLKPALIASAWAQISASQQHMYALGCVPFRSVIDPSVYSGEVSRCRSARPGAEACQLSNWTRRESAVR